MSPAVRPRMYSPPMSLSQIRSGPKPAAALVVCLEETRAVRDALAWARPGDVLVLPIHEPAARDEVVALLDRLQATRWHAGMALPDA